VLASHSLPEIRRLCQAGILIRNGTLTYFDKVEDAIKAYSTAPAEVVEKTPESLLKAQRLKQQYVNLKLQEQRQEKMLAVFKDADRRDDVEKRLQNTRDHLLALSFELRTLREEPPKPREWEGLAIELDPVARTSPYAHKIFLLQRKIEQLRIDETRQELNANKAEGRRKKKDFLERLKVTRHNLAAVQHELQELQARAAAEARQPAAQTPAAIAKSAAVPQTMAAAPAAPSNRQ